MFSQDRKDEISITEVTVQGNLATSKNTIIFTAGLRKGQNVSISDFPRAVKRLWQLGLFQDVQIKIDEETSEGLSIIIEVKENYILGDIVFNGNKKIKNQKFNDEIKLSSGQRIKPNTIMDVEKSIRLLYADKGYLNVDIFSELSEPAENTDNKGLVRNLIFTIKENKKVKIGKIIIDGNKAVSDLRLRWEMKETKQQRWYLFWRSTYDKKKFNEDKNLISTYYRNKGYRDFQILSDSVKYSSNGKKMNIILYVDEGPQYKYRRFSWEGMTLFDENTLQRTLSLDEGEIYSDEDFNMAVFSRVQGLYLDRGYIYSRVDPKIIPIGKDSLDIHFMITENHKVFINNIYIAGNTRTRENVIRRQLRVFPGDVYSQDLIARSYREVMMLNFLQMLRQILFRFQKTR